MIDYIKNLFTSRWARTGNTQWITTQDLPRYYYQEEHYEYRHKDTGEIQWRTHPARTQYRFVEKPYN
jgi:hypothetical protein